MPSWTLENVQSALHEQDLDGWLLYDFRGSNPVAVQASGLSHTGTRRWFLWVPRQGAAQLLIHAIESSTFAQFNPSLPAAPKKYVSWRELHAGLCRLLSGQRRVAMEYSPGNAVPYLDLVDAGVLELVRACSDCQVVSSADLVQSFQAALSPAQCEEHRQAAAKVLQVKDQAFSYTAAELRVGRDLNEFELQTFVASQLTELGLDYSHPLVVAVNANAADPHYEPSASLHSPIRPGDMLLIDLWGKSRGNPNAVFADVTWTAFCGSQVPAKAAVVFQVVARARDACIAYIRDELRQGRSVRGCDADDVCRQVIAEAGFGEFFIHRTGHSLGSEIHFSGANIDNLETEDRRSLAPGLLFTIEPGIYMPDCDFDDSGRCLGLGIRSEVNCLVRDGDLEVTTLPLQENVLTLLP